MSWKPNPDTIDPETGEYQLMWVDDGDGSPDTTGSDPTPVTPAQTAAAVTEGNDLSPGELVANAQASGAGSSVLDTVSEWIKANPTLAKTLGSMAVTSVANAQQQSYARELSALRNQWDIDKTNAANARSDLLWQRRNDSISGTKAADLGIIGRAMIDPTVYARK